MKGSKGVRFSRFEDLASSVFIKQLIGFGVYIGLRISRNGIICNRIL